MKRKVISFLFKNSTLIKYLSIVFNVVASIALIMWLLNKDITICKWSLDKEALFVILTSVAVLLNQFHKWLLAEAEYSPAYALALGYVNNFIEPVITQLIEDGIKTPLVYIYRPKTISELYKTNIDKTKATIKNMQFDLTELQLNLKHGRARDILTIQKSKTKKVFFDFPNTLLSLSAYIDYKTSSGANQFNDKEKVKLTEELFEKFYSKINDLTKEKNLDEYIKYCDKKLNFTF
jgi:hypothetical protein